MSAGNLAVASPPILNKRNKMLSNRNIRKQFKSIKIPFRRFGFGATIVSKLMADFFDLPLTQPDFPDYAPQKWSKDVLQK